MTHTCDAIVISCIDFRIQKYVSHWLKERYPKYRSFDRVALSGGGFDLYAILNQIDISDRLHKIKNVLLINHEDCGAYGDAGSYEHHVHDLTRAVKMTKTLYPHLNITAYYLHMDGTFDAIAV